MAFPQMGRALTPTREAGSGAEQLPGIVETGSSPDALLCDRGRPRAREEMSGTGSGCCAVKGELRGSRLRHPGKGRTVVGQEVRAAGALRRGEMNSGGPGPGTVGTTVDEPETLETRHCAGDGAYPETNPGTQPVEDEATSPAKTFCRSPGQPLMTRDGVSFPVRTCRWVMITVLHCE